MAVTLSPAPVEFLRMLFVYADELELLSSETTRRRSAELLIRMKKLIRQMAPSISKLEKSEMP